MLTKEILIKRNEEKFLTSDLGAEVVLMNMESGDYVGLNEVAGDIWKILENSTIVGDLLDQLQQIYEVPEGQCETDSMECLDNMIKSEMVLQL